MLVILHYSCGVMDGGFVLVKLLDGVKRRSRHMQVVVSHDFTSTEHLRMSDVAWYNLGGKLFHSEKEVSVKVCLVFLLYLRYFIIVSLN